jgi:hypothetical protein
MKQNLIKYDIINDLLWLLWYVIYIIHICMTCEVQIGKNVPHKYRIDTGSVTHVYPPSTDDSGVPFSPLGT